MERDKAEAERLKTEKKAELARKQEEAKKKAETARKLRAEEIQRRKLAAEAAQRSPSSPIRFIGLPDDEDDLLQHQVKAFPWFWPRQSFTRISHSRSCTVLCMIGPCVDHAQAG